MSNFYRLTTNPVTLTKEMAIWVDNYFGHGEYGILFKGYANPFREIEIPKQVSGRTKGLLVKNKKINELKYSKKIRMSGLNVAEQELLLTSYKEQKDSIKKLKREVNKLNGLIEVLKNSKL